MASLYEKTVARRLTQKLVKESGGNQQKLLAALKKQARATGASVAEAAKQARWNLPKNPVGTRPLHNAHCEKCGGPEVRSKAGPVNVLKCMRCGHVQAELKRKIAAVGEAVVKLKLKWRGENPGDSMQAPLSFDDAHDYVISHRNGKHIVSYRPVGQHVHVGDFATPEAAKDAAQRHHDSKKEDMQQQVTFSDAGFARQCAEALADSPAYNVVQEDATVRFKLPTGCDVSETIAPFSGTLNEDAPVDVWTEARAKANAGLTSIAQTEHTSVPWQEIGKVLTQYGFEGESFLGVPPVPDQAGGAGLMDVGKATLRMIWLKNESSGKYKVTAELRPLGEARLDEAVSNDLPFTRIGGALYEAGPEMTADQVASATRRSSRDDDRDPLARSYIQYIRSGNSYSPAGEVILAEKLGSYAYNVSMGMTGPVFIRVKPQTDALLRFKNSAMEEVLEEVDKFWDLKEKYQSLGFMHNRGILLFGEPGGGKSCLIQQIIEMITSNGDVVFFTRRVDAVLEGLKAFRQVEPDRKVVVVMEDADEYVGHQEQELLQLLDGENAQDSVCWLATTNYLNRFPQRLLRPGRFDKKVYVGMPPEEGRYAYLKNKLAEKEPDNEIHRLAQESEGFSFGHLREMVIAIYALGEPKDKVIARLKADPSTQPVV